MNRAKALGLMHEHYAPARWPQDWYGYEMDLGWAFISPNRPGLIVVVARNGRVDDLRYTEPAGATAAGRRRPRVLPARARAGVR